MSFFELFSAFVVFVIMIETAYGLFLAPTKGFSISAMLLTNFLIGFVIIGLAKIVEILLKRESKSENESEDADKRNTLEIPEMLTETETITENFEMQTTTGEETTEVQTTENATENAKEKQKEIVRKFHKKVSIGERKIIL